jgi:pimeloyl-[acyl-carrier protein] methyl ester esterase
LEEIALIKPRFTLHHGWGFSSNIWNGWMQHLEPEFEVENLDRGYFGVSEAGEHERQVELSRREMRFQRFGDRTKTRNMRIVVAHSFGLHLLPQAVLEDTDMLVCIGSFMHFAAPDDRLARRTLQRMQSRFEQAPREVLSEFHQKCFDTSGLRLLSPAIMKDEADWNIEMLAADLKQLETSKLNDSSLLRIPHILLLHGLNDIIVPPVRAYELQRYLPHSRLILHNSANHALPFLQMDWCLQQIMCYVDEIESLQSLQSPGRKRIDRVMVGALDS